MHYVLWIIVLASKVQGRWRNGTLGTIFRYSLFSRTDQFITRTGMMEHLPKIRLNLPSIFNWEIDAEAWLLFTPVSASFQRCAIRKEQIGALEQM